MTDSDPGVKTILNKLEDVKQELADHKLSIAEKDGDIKAVVSKIETHLEVGTNTMKEIRQAVSGVSTKLTQHEEKDNNRFSRVNWLLAAMIGGLLLLSFLPAVLPWIRGTSNQTDKKIELILEEVQKRP